MKDMVLFPILLGLVLQPLSTSFGDVEETEIFGQYRDLDQVKDWYWLGLGLQRVQRGS